MAKQSALDKAIQDLREQKAPLEARINSIDTAIAALDKMKIVARATKPKSTRKPKEPAAQAAEVKA